MENKLDTSFSCKAGAKLKMHGHTVYSLRKEENQESQRTRVSHENLNIRVYGSNTQMELITISVNNLLNFICF